MCCDSDVVRSHLHLGGFQRVHHAFPLIPDDTQPFATDSTILVIWAVWEYLEASRTIAKPKATSILMGTVLLVIDIVRSAEEALVLIAK